MWRGKDRILRCERDGKTVATSSENEDAFLIAEWNAKRIRKELDELVITQE